MKKYILGTLFTLCLLISPTFVSPAEAASLTPVQVSAIVSLLQALGVDQSVINTIQTSLGGGSTTSSGTSPTASLTINGQPSVINADPLVQRTWAWSGTPGSAYSASGNITGCDTTSQNGPQQNWKPWTDTKSTGNATNGSSSVIPGAVKYGCVIVGTYNVTKNGQTTTATATITYRHANGSVNTATVNPSGLQTTSGIPAGNMPAIVNSSGLQITSENLPAGNIPVPGTTNANSVGLAYTTTLTYSGGTGTPIWSLVQEDGKLPNVTLNKDTGVISGSLYDLSGDISGIYYFTVKLTVGSDVVTKRLSILMNSYVVASASQIKILTTTLPPAVVGKPYYATIAINPEMSVSDNSWIALSVQYNVYGSTFIQKIPGFPEGLVIDEKTGVISGIPVRIGTTSFYVTATHKQFQSDGSQDNMYYTIQVASSPDVTRLVSLKSTGAPGSTVVNNNVVTDIYALVSTANFSDGSLVGQKIVWRQVGEMHNRVRGFQGFYCLKNYSPWSDEGIVPGITVKDLASKSFPATKVHTYGIQFQITSPGVYEFAASATSAGGSTSKAIPHRFFSVSPYVTEGDLSQSDYQALSVEQRNIPDTCDVSQQTQASSAVVVSSFEEEVTNGWGGVASANMCTSWTYSSTYGACQSNGTQSKMIVSAFPAGCTGGTPQVPTQSCTYTTPVCTGTHPGAGNGVTLSDYTDVAVGPSGPSNTIWRYGVGSCGWSCTAPMLQDGNYGCKSPTPGSGVTITLNNLSTGGKFSGVALTPGTVIGMSVADVPGSPFVTDSNGKTPEFWLQNFGGNGGGWTVVVVPVPGYKISSASGCTPAVGIQAGQTLNRCTSMQNGTSVVINLEPDTAAASTVNPVVTVSNSGSGPFTTNGTVYNNLPLYARIGSTNVNMKSYSPQGCIQPAGTSGCSSNLGYRDFLSSEWLDNSTIQTVIQDPSVYPLTTYELYLKFPGGSPIKAGSFTLLSGASNVSAVPHLTTLSPASGTVGTTVTINGSGFTGTNSIYLNGTSVDTESSSGGSTPTWISFVIPSNLPSCPGYDRLCTPGPVLTPGTYTVRVQNTNGTSNAVSLGVN